MARPLDLDRLLAPDYASGLDQLSMDDLRARKAECNHAEDALSYLRRLVQVRLDIVRAELRSRGEGGSGELSELVEHLPEILAEGGTRTVAGRLPTLGLPDVDHRVLAAELDAILDVEQAGSLPETDLADVQAVEEGLQQLERRVSDQRRALHERLDAIEAEIVRRYKSGEASVDSLLS